jgi:hypothetical protein
MVSSAPENKLALDKRGAASNPPASMVDCFTNSRREVAAWLEFSVLIALV